MVIIPAVDIKGGKAVRLVQGRADQETVYDNDPVHAARSWAEHGPKRLHVVDLDGAFDGLPKNSNFTFAIIKELKGILDVEVGGGLRSADAVATLLEAGAARCVIGTRAVEDRDFLRDMAQRFPKRICIGLDAKDGMLATKGWTEVSAVSAVDLLANLCDLPLAEVIYTDIERDGMLSGPNFKRLREVQRASALPVIASGGVTTLEHVKELRAIGCFGAIIGKALYDGRLDLGLALKAAEEKA